MWRLRLAVVCSAFLLAAASTGGDAEASAVPHTVVVAAARGHLDRALAAVRRDGGRIVLRRGRLLQVQIPSARVTTLRRAAGVAGVGPAQVAWPDAVISQGVYRIGADAVQAAGYDGTGVRVAVLDLGFGADWPSLEGTELPPASRIQTMSFDETTGKGLAGLSATDQETSHGQQVAQVVHDIAPAASLVLVNYHTELEFEQAVDWLDGAGDGQRRADIIVHSNSFLDGPFDGTGPTAQAVDRARAAGMLWVNSAGNYALHHWEGAVGDADHNGWADIAGDRHDGLVFTLPAQATIGATLMWSNCEIGARSVAASAVDYEIDVTDDDSATPTPLAQGQRDPTRALESVGFASPAGGVYQLRVQQKTRGAVCTLELFGGGVDLGDQTVPASSVPTPGDATGSLTVGAVAWTDNTLASYSSQGPTEDGRLKPDLVAPASTVVWPGWAMVGTSASAPHVAGAAALLMQRARVLGQPSDPAAITTTLESEAVDMGAPGPDEATGYGRLRLDLTPPQIVTTTPASGALVHGGIRLGVDLVDDGTIDSSGVSIDGTALATATGQIGVTWLTSTLPDGQHTATFWATDMSGNRTQVDVPFTIDNAPPAVTQLRGPSGNAIFAVRDAFAPAGTAMVTISDRLGNAIRSLRLPLTFAGGVALARVAAPDDGLGPYRLRVQAIDSAGNPSAPYLAALPVPLL